MKKCLSVWLLLLTAIATQAQVSRETTEQKIDSLLPANTARLITPIRLQTAFRKVLDYVQPNIINGGLSPTKISSGGASTGQVLKWNGSEWIPATHVPTWGAIEGDLSNQADLQDALSQKMNMADTTAFLQKATAGAMYVAKEVGKVLSSNDYTTTEKSKLLGIDALLSAKSEYIEVSTYASLIALSTPLVSTLYKVANDENKGISNSFYLWWPTGKRLWVAAAEDN